MVRLPDWRKHGVDLDRLVEAYRLALEVAHRPELSDTCRPAHSPRESDDDLRSAIRANSWSVPHFVGTCAMGPASSPRAVVDSHGGVHGTEALSVIDASIIPIIPSGFTHLTTLMMAERLSGDLGGAMAFP